MAKMDAGFRRSRETIFEREVENLDNLRTINPKRVLGSLSSTIAILLDLLVFANETPSLALAEFKEKRGGELLELWDREYAIVAAMFERGEVNSQYLPQFAQLYQIMFFSWFARKYQHTEKYLTDVRKGMEALNAVTVGKYTTDMLLTLERFVGKRDAAYPASKYQYDKYVLPMRHYLELMQNVAAGKSLVDLIAEIDTDFEARNTNKRLNPDGYGVLGTGKIPARWDFYKYAVLQYAKDHYPHMRDVELSW